jgi:hypothetical protein
VKNGEWMVQFRRRLDGSMKAKWDGLVERLRGVVIIEEDDRVIWAHEKGGQY